MTKKVVIVGKPNVGKSQIFNRLTGEKHSIVFDTPGVTRDRVSLEVNWLNKKFILTDTGGYSNKNFSFQEEINRQVTIALSEADLVLFVISCKGGIDSDDLYLSKILKKTRVKNVLLVANKCDSEQTEELEEYKLGFGEAIYISAEHGINTGVLLDSIVSNLSLLPEDTNELKRTKIAVIGKPNVGKSSFVNALLNEARIITSDIAGTTRDAIDLDLDFREDKYTLIDTPGIRRHASIRKNELERYSILRAKKAISRAEILLLMLDISESLFELDERIAGLIYDANIPTIIVANKWDLVENKTDFGRREIEKVIRQKFKFLFWAPIVFISALKKEKLDVVFRTLEEINLEINKKIDESLFNNFLYKVSSLFAIPKVSGKKIKLFSISKVKSQIPTFLILCNNPDLLHFSYSRLIENQIRECFNYKKTPISLIFKKK